LKQIKNFFCYKIIVKNREYQICKNCVMDTSDSNIVFDENGTCDYCLNYRNNILPNWKTGEEGKKIISKIVEQIKYDGKNKEYDCLIGISGGIDSSYLTYLAKEKFKLRPLIFHVDGGWNTQIAVNNIEKIIDGLKLDLHTEVINWNEMRDLQLSFFKAQVNTLDTPQDHAFFASLYNFANKNKFKYILTGANFSTECVREPLEWNYHTSDLIQIKDIHNKFGKVKLSTFPTADILKYKIYYRFFKGIRVIQPLNNVTYIKDDAVKLLKTKFGWQEYAHKHYESRFTRFYEGYWLPKKFGFDKRRNQYSSLILTEQMKRDDALKKLSQPAYNPETIMHDFEYIASKLDISVEEFKQIMKGKNKTYKDYKNKMYILSLGTFIMRLFGEKRIIR
tara:strand:- start:12972 stop:14147 length:1176 start_codon:yes stop_codon:yes gene_type:complete